MNGHLIPQKRMDKTGKLVTRHVRAGVQQLPAKSALPAPSAPIVTAKASKPVTTKKPLAKQTKVQQRMGTRSHHSPDPALYDALGVTPDELWDLTMINASDVQMYDLFSILRTDDAVLLIDRGYTDPESVKDLLEKNNLGHLLIDRRDLMTEAQNRRIDAFNFMEAQHKFGINDMECDPQILLGAVRLDDSLVLPRWATGGEPDSFAHAVMRGDISFDDVMTIGMGNLSSAASAPQLCGYLRDIHSGKAGYDAELLSHLMQKTGYNTQKLDRALGMVSEYGANFMSKVNFVDVALDINDIYRARPTAQRAEVIMYAQQGLPWFANLKHDEIVKLYDNHIPADEAKEMMAQRMDVDRIIAVHKEGISKSVSSGWL